MASTVDIKGLYVEANVHVASPEKGHVTTVTIRYVNDEVRILVTKGESDPVVVTTII